MGISSAKKTELNILHDVSGIIKPGRYSSFPPISLEVHIFHDANHPLPENLWKRISFYLPTGVPSGLINCFEAGFPVYPRIRYSI